MLIEPVQPIVVIIKAGEHHYTGQMISLTDKLLQLKCSHYLEKESHITFLGKYFRGNAVVTEVNFSKLFFLYQMTIEDIQFQPGLLINTKL